MIPTTRTWQKGLRDLGVMLVLTALLYVGENAVDFGVPETLVPIVAGAAMLVYRWLRDVTGKGPAE